MDELLVESAQRRLEATPGMRGSISADCKFFPVIDTDGQLKPQNMVPDVSQPAIGGAVVRMYLQRLCDPSEITFARHGHVENCRCVKVHAA